MATTSNLRSTRALALRKWAQAQESFPAGVVPAPPDGVSPDDLGAIAQAIADARDERKARLAALQAYTGYLTERTKEFDKVRQECHALLWLLQQAVEGDSVPALIEEAKAREEAETVRFRAVSLTSEGVGK